MPFGTPHPQSGIRTILRSALTACGVVAAGAAAAVPVPCTGDFSFTGAVQSCTVTTDGVYTLLAAGASGGSTTIINAPGGLGASASGDFVLTAGEVLTLYVGGTGGAAVIGAGGGGGSFILSGTTVLVVGGGGGGAASLTAGGNASLTPDGIAGVNLGGAGGTGGSSGGARNGSGGGGILASGANSALGGTGGSGLNALPPLAGGTGPGADGGYGGGGSSGSAGGGGGGGGYSGGGGGGAGTAGIGGGGGSFVDMLGADGYLANASITQNTGRGNGSITLTYLSAVSVPEPATLVLFSGGTLLLGWTRRRRYAAQG